jgi:hypothetical protein
VAVVTAVAVVPTARGAGIGASLLERFLVEVRKAGTPAAELVTQADGEGASAFYTNLGWSAQDVHADHDGALVRRFRLELATGSSADRADRASGANGANGAHGADGVDRVAPAARGTRGTRGTRGDRNAPRDKSGHSDHSEPG